MGRAAKAYIYGVIGAGGFVFACSVRDWSSADPSLWLLYTALAILASLIKLRLPGLDGTYSLNFLFILYGIAHLPLNQTLIAACAGAVTQTLLNKKKSSGLLQVLFNIGNLSVSVGVCFLVGRIWMTSGLTHYLPAVIALIAGLYFAVNTVLVSGVLSLVRNQPLRGIFQEWYVWSFPYYLIGVVLVALFPAPGYGMPGQAWLAMLPMLYLVHFFVGLARRQDSSPAVGDKPNAALPRRAHTFVTIVLTACLIVLAKALIGWQAYDPVRTVVFVALAILASTFKVRLPRMRGSISPAFVLTLASVAQLGFTETVFMAAIVGLVQVLWKPTRLPMLAQVLFNPACLTLSAGVAWFLCRIALAPWLGDSVTGVVVVATLSLFGVNTLLVSTVLALVDGKPLSTVWQSCYLWSMPYYLVGAAIAGLMTAVSRIADWPNSLLVLPIIALLYISYGVQLSRVTAKQVTA